MFYEIRTYQLRNGTAPAYLAAIADGIAIQKRHLGQLVGYFVSEIGPLNEIVHIWAYASLDDREKRRAALAADPDWQAVLARFRDFIVTANSKIMKPAPFWQGNADSGGA